MRRQGKHAGAFAVLALLAAAARGGEPAPGEFKVPGTESTIKLYGYVQLDTTVDFAGRPAGYENSDWATFLGVVPADDSAGAPSHRPTSRRGPAGSACRPGRRRGSASSACGWRATSTPPTVS